jgi:hypothetical protein
MKGAPITFNFEQMPCFGRRLRTGASLNSFAMRSTGQGELASAHKK